ncbi:hypothetical protein IS481_03020 [Caldimonas thermodepolymerans]|jgi:hypothetical protein|uniref:Uncharacterized protein n=1 Tax=Caldimonas thermodepolymerans TaxID=215580 RepID=A0A2S5T5A9_9BURK|nr:hypothetical protein [Caldimonas thermodepolymerans]PPE70173.1 hypothetical protein C1702_07905 [Caldimonas thermodepolymerans]QPC32167.1 hypothetical protein IS481_03020 [Caldimonas thermodepolymerans]RDH98053.1 hypothetical protein DES46_10751 [Caldimonas thermodepolymerans]TCP08172.1 hypothetical protein EV676_103205 [Caldimonas thermodepolymerans]UZG48711.1 hypothetical protein ONS87_03560 [Caldimonas thermodepolymerans]
MHPLPAHREPPLGPGVPPPDPAEPPEPAPLDAPPGPDRDHPVLWRRARRRFGAGNAWVYRLHRTGAGAVRGPVGSWNPLARGRLGN